MSGGSRDDLRTAEGAICSADRVAVMSKYKPRVVKHPVKVQRGNSSQIVYCAVRDIQHLKNSQTVGTTRINKQSQMVRKEGIYWVVI